LEKADSNQIEVPYNYDMKRLESELAKVQRPGDFFVRGVFETPMPRVNIDGVGLLSFPIPDSQIRDIVKRADRAPYGRGRETILDTAVRRAWQLAPEQFSITGKSWERCFQQILSTVFDGLGCAGMGITAELYKMLVYEAGGFFLPHRDTEKTEGMFGTLVIVLPSTHRGGELLIRHAGREVTVDLSNGEISELTFAAFYADCEHQVQTVTEGARVCLTYNLVERSTQNKGTKLNAPLYDAEVGATAALFAEAFETPGTPAKLAWLLEHQYSPAGLSFAGLKGRDAALAKVLRRAAAQAKCAVYLGIVHIEESGSAEPYFDEGYRWRRGNRYYDMDDDVHDETEDADDSSEFEVIEVCDGSRYVDQWMNTDDCPAEFGAVPIEDGEILPAGALDDEKPDKQRLTEATGNEGASFERSYHRAALVLWPRNRFIEVLLEAGPGAALPYFHDRVQDCCTRPVPDPDRDAVASIAGRIIDAWEAGKNNPYSSGEKEPNRNAMIALLVQFGNVPLLERFIGGVVTREYDGSENEALLAGARLLGPEKTLQLFSSLAEKNMRLFPGACVNLLKRMTGGGAGCNREADYMAALRGIGATVVEALPELGGHKPAYPDRDWRRAQKATRVDATMLADLLESLAALNAGDLRAAACAACTADVAVFNPEKVIVPALELVHENRREAVSGDAEFRGLWIHAAEFLLARSEHPPDPPEDWRQQVKISCRCDDCREIQAFALEPGEKTHRFRVNKERRQHLHQQIQHHGLDITHVTERIGSPQTLVCTKTRATYERERRRHQTDLESMAVLLRVMNAAAGPAATLATRLKAARKNQA
jgi:2OG-Fe(II) oxygenase superfamily